MSRLQALFPLFCSLFDDRRLILPGGHIGKAAETFGKILGIIEMQHIGNLGNIVTALPEQFPGFLNLQRIIIMYDPVVAVAGKQGFYGAFTAAGIFHHIPNGDLVIDVFLQVVQNLHHRVGNIHTVDQATAPHFFGYHILTTAHFYQKHFQQVFGHLAAAVGGRFYLYHIGLQGILRLCQSVARKSLIKQHGKQRFFFPV